MTQVTLASQVTHMTNSHIIMRVISSVCPDRKTKVARHVLRNGLTIESLRSSDSKDSCEHTSIQTFISVSNTLLTLPTNREV